MGASQGSTPRPSADLQKGDYFDPSKLGSLPPDTSNALTPVENMKPVDSGSKQKVGNALAGAGAGIAQGLASLDQQPQQVAAGPQLGAGVNQAQVTDPYQAYLLKLQQQNQQQTPFYGN